MSNNSAATKTESVNEDLMAVICFSGKSPPQVVGSLETQLKAVKGVEFSRANTLQGAQAHATKSRKAVTILCISEKNELVEVMNFLVTMADRIASGSLRVMVISRINHPKIPLMLKGKGAGEVLDYNVTAKALGFKLNTSLKLVHQSVERVRKAAAKAAADPHQQHARHASKPLSGQTIKQSDSGSQTVWDKPLDFASDIWLVTNKKNVRCVLGRWLIHLLGPGPSIGTWEATDLKFQGETGWEWKPRQGKESSFIADEGRWIFFGRQPEFIWAKKLWSFVSNHPTLAFYNGLDPYHYRMLCEKGDKLIIPENSKFATDKLDGIKRTIDSSIKFRDDKKKGSDTSEAVIFDDFSQADGGVIDKTQKRTTDESDEGWDEDEGASALLGSKDEEEDLDWSSLKKKPKEGQDDGEGDLIDLRPKRNRTDDSDEIIPMSSKGKAWKTGKDAFQSISLTLDLKERNGAPVATPVQLTLIETRNEEILIDAPAYTVQVDDWVVFHLKMIDGSNIVEFNVEGKVKGFEGDPSDERNVVICGVTGTTKIKVEEVFNNYIERQAELLEFFQSVKGF